MGYKFVRDDESTIRDVPLAFALGAGFALSLVLALVVWRLLIGRFPFVSEYTKRGTVLSAEFGYEAVDLKLPPRVHGIPDSLSYSRIERVSRFRHVVYLNTGSHDDMFVLPRALFPESALDLMRRAGVRT
ncbi:hypothetical protein ABZV91_12315 [Nocardia sp. NPDC004568]|uniref:hypothetical protein n=1 Tax=Nocardia sp. NPDC004568 TaxID=3154551 RepID=UPI0033BAE1B9